MKIQVEVFYPSVPFQLIEVEPKMMDALRQNPLYGVPTMYARYKGGEIKLYPYPEDEK
jgi:hypothetical protein